MISDGKDDIEFTALDIRTRTQHSYLKIVYKKIMDAANKGNYSVHVSLLSDYTKKYLLKKGFTVQYSDDGTCCKILWPEK